MPGLRHRRDACATNKKTAQQRYAVLSKCCSRLGYLPARRRAAQRAFIISLSFFRAAADMRPRRRDFLPPPPALRPPLTRAQRARAAAAILARVAADMVRRLRCLPPPVFAPALVVARPPPTKPANRRSRASIWRRKETACSNCLSDKSMTTFLAVRQLCAN